LINTKIQLKDGFNMKYLIYGEDKDSREKKITSILGDFSKKGFEVFYINDATFDQENFLNQILSKSLFGSNPILVLNHCLSTKETREFLEAKSKEIIDTETPIIFVESEFLKKDFPSFKKCFSEVFEYKKEKINQSKKYNIFPLIDAVVSKNKKSAWLLFQEATEEGVVAEEIINLLFWQYKTLSLVSIGGTAESLGMKPFVFIKSKNLLSKYSKMELRQTMFSLIKIFQDSRFEKDGLERLEKLILS